MAAAKSRYRKKKAGAAKARKVGGQQPLFRRGGKRRGAGRKSHEARPGRRHERRADFSARHPLHVVLRVDEAIGTLRRRAMYKAIREATITAAQRQRIRIIHLSLQRSHVHMIVEAADREALARGMQGFQISSARHINRALGRELARAGRELARAGRGQRVALPSGVAPRRGRVFVDRYYVEIITSPTQALRALAYVLSNWRRHGEDRSTEARTWLVDPFSSSAQFAHWVELERGEAMRPLAAMEPLAVCKPTTWLLTDGWRRVGSISAWTVPGPKARGATSAR